MAAVKYVREGDTRVRTVGLVARPHPELVAQAGSRDLLDECEGFLKTIVSYIESSGGTIKPNETVEYGYWLTKFLRGEDGSLEAWEYGEDGETFQPGVRLSLTYWRDQHTVCKKAQSNFMPPRPDRLAVVSAGVYEGELVDGVRYQPTGEMSGWHFYTDQYNGDIRSLKYEHLYHVTAQRSDLARYLALEPGFWVDLRSPDDIRFDQGAAGRSR